MIQTITKYVFVTCIWIILWDESLARTSQEISKEKNERLPRSVEDEVGKFEKKAGPEEEKDNHSTVEIDDDQHVKKDAKKLRHSEAKAKKKNMEKNPDQSQRPTPKPSKPKLKVKLVTVEEGGSGGTAFIIILLLMAIAGGVGFFIWRKKKKAAAETQPTKNTPDDVQLDDKEQKQALLSDNKE